MFSLRIFRRTLSGLAVVVLGLFVLTLSTGAAMAQAINAEGAAKLKADVQRMLDRQVNNYNNQSGGGELQRDGELSVTPASGYYAVVLPHLSLKAADGGTTDIGVIKVNAIPAGEDLWRVTMAIPTPLTSFDATGIPRAKFSIGQQQFTGVWHAKYDTYIESNLDYSDIHLEFSDAATNGKGVVDIGNVRGSSRFDDQGAGKYSGPYDFTLENVRFSGTGPQSGEPTEGSIARVEVKGRMVNADLKKAYDFQTNMESRVEGMQGAQPEANAQAGKEILADIMDYMTSFADDFNTSFNLQGLDVRVNDPNNPNGPFNLKMDKVGFDFGMDGMNRDTLTMRINYGVEDVTMVPAPPQASSFLPFSLVFNITSENLPHKVLTGLIQDNVSARIDAENGQAPANMPNPGQTMMDVKNATADAGSVVRLDGTRLSAGDLDARLSGEIRASRNAMMGAVVDIKLVLGGIDKVMAMLSQPGTPPEVMQQGMGILGMLQSMGKPEVGDNGGNVLVYNLLVNESGQATLNGNPLPVPGMGGGMGGGMGNGGMQGGPMPLP